MPFWKHVGPRPYSFAACGLAENRFDARMVLPGDVIEANDAPGQWTYGATTNPADWQEIPDPRERAVPTTPAEWVVECDVLAAAVGDLPLQPVIAERLDVLVDAALDSGFVDLPETHGCDERIARVVLNKLRQWAEEENSDEVTTQRTTEEVSHSADFRSLSWFGTDYEFTPMQAACVAVLFEAWQGGSPVLGQDYILERADSNGNKLRDVFGKGTHPAWDTMIVSPRKGAYRLAEPQK